MHFISLTIPTFPSTITYSPYLFNSADFLINFAATLTFIHLIFVKTQSIIQTIAMLHFALTISLSSSFNPIQ